jgi:hypothetical protein
MVEPMQEFLRRAFIVEFPADTMGNVERSKRGLVFAQAMVLGQVGMLYAGSTKLLHFGKAQRSALIELASMLHISITSIQFRQWSTHYGSYENTEGSSWELAMVNECRRRLICSIFIYEADVRLSYTSH